MANTAAFRRQVADRIAAIDRATPVPIVVGFDGFVDNIIDVVEQRRGPGDYSPMPTIASLGERIDRAAGKSANIELVVRISKIGGNGPIMANAMLSLGHALHYIGNLGDGVPHPVFAPLVDRAEEVITLGEPSMTDALEFTDGKLMLGKLATLDQVNEARLREVVGVERLRVLFKQAAVIATVNWTMLLGMTEIWRFLGEEICPDLGPDRPLWFVDLADPAKRPTDDLREALKVIATLQDHADMVLGLNEMETRQVAAVLDIGWPETGDELEQCRQAVVAIRELLGIERVVCHLVASACVAGAEAYSMEGFFDPRPRITTGAGDHFNAGFMAALAAGCADREAVLIGTATSGYYVRTTQSPSWDQLAEFITSWE